MNHVWYAFPCGVKKVRVIQLFNYSDVLKHSYRKYKGSDKEFLLVSNL